MATLGFEPGEAFLASVAEAAIKAISELNPQNLRCVVYKHHSIRFQPLFYSCHFCSAPGKVLPLQWCQPTCRACIHPCTIMGPAF